MLIVDQLLSNVYPKVHPDDKEVDKTGDQAHGRNLQAVDPWVPEVVDSYPGKVCFSNIPFCRLSLPIITE